MKISWLHNNGQKQLIIFCNGWGMDEHPFKPLAAIEYDVLMLNCYYGQDSKPDLAHLFNKYSSVSLVAWSMGVWIGQQLCSPFRDQFEVAIAINGTLCPIDDNFGIPIALVRGTRERLDEENRLKFYRRMCRGSDFLPLFLQHQPTRTVKDQRQELAALEQYVTCRHAEDSLYTRVIVASNDSIIPTANQLRFWQNQVSCKIKGSHFLFYNWQSWDQLVSLEFIVP